MNLIWIIHTRLSSKLQLYYITSFIVLLFTVGTCSKIEQTGGGVENYYRFRFAQDAKGGWIKPGKTS